MPSTSARNFKRTGDTAAGVCTGLAHTYTCRQMFSLALATTENSPNNLSVTNEEIKGYGADNGTGTTRHHGGIYASNPHTAGRCRAVQSTPLRSEAQQPHHTCAKYPRRVRKAAASRNGWRGAEWDQELTASLSYRAITLSPG